MLQLLADKIPPLSRDVGILFSEYHLVASVRAHLTLQGSDKTYNEFALPGQIAPANPDEAVIILALAERG